MARSLWRNPGFSTTSWTLIREAAEEPRAATRAAFEVVCEKYWPPVYAFIRRSGYSLDEAQDLTQAFFVRLLEKNYLQSADQSRGRFRTFLLAAVTHFLANERDRMQALKRGGPMLTCIRITADDVAAEEDWREAEAVEYLTPEKIFERRWAISVLEKAMCSLRSSFARIGKERDFEKLSQFLTAEGDPSCYQSLAAELGTSPGALRVSIHRLRRKYGEMLRAEIAGTVSTESEMDEEIRFLLSALSV